MQGIDQIAYQNACKVALHHARDTDQEHYVFRDEHGQLSVGAHRPADSDLVYTAKPNGLEV